MQKIILDQLLYEVTYVSYFFMVFIHNAHMILLKHES